MRRQRAIWASFWSRKARAWPNSDLTRRLLTRYRQRRPSSRRSMKPHHNRQPRCSDTRGWAAPIRLTISAWCSSPSSSNSSRIRSRVASPIARNSRAINSVSASWTGALSTMGGRPAIPGPEVICITVSFVRRSRADTGASSQRRTLVGSKISKFGALAVDADPLVATRGTALVAAGSAVVVLLDGPALPRLTRRAGESAHAGKE